MTTMPAAVLVDPGGAQPLRIQRVAVPEPGPTEVLIAVAAFGINNAEILQCRGVMPAPPGGIPGLECAGTVVAVGSAVSAPKVGDRVAALTRAGTYAEYVAVPAGACLVLPDGLDPVIAGAVPEAAATAWWNLVHRGRLRSGERVLIHGAAGGVGSLAVQLARARGAVVTGTARGAAKTALCTELGAHRVIDYAGTDVFEAARRCEPGGYDIILDNQGASTLDANIGLLAPQGRLVIVGVAGGSQAQIDLGSLMAAGAEVSSSSLGRLPDETRAALCAELAVEVLPALVAGRLRPVLDTTFGLERIADAHRRFTEPDRVGKVVVTVSGCISKTDVEQRI